VRFETAKINPAVVVAEAVNGINSLARRRGVQLSLADASTATPVTADPRRLKQAVTIILENAIKYSPQRSRIDVGVSEDSVGDKVISIRDTGIGIPEGELPHIFDRFFRGESARAESSGSGLGLTIARSIVEKHGGRIEVNSAVGKGTEAKVVLPVNAHPA
jgi:signal transduction histidine kinase